MSKVVMSDVETPQLQALQIEQFLPVTTRKTFCRLTFQLLVSLEKTVEVYLPWETENKGQAQLFHAEVGNIGPGGLLSLTWLNTYHPAVIDKDNIQPVGVNVEGTWG